MIACQQHSPTWHTASEIQPPADATQPSPRVNRSTQQRHLGSIPDLAPMFAATPARSRTKGEPEESAIDLLFLGRSLMSTTLLPCR
jgi:hypothetical protein